MSSLSFILHPRVMKRLTDSSQYGNKYLPNEVLEDIFNGIFVPREVPGTFKMNLQSAYVDGLIAAMDDRSYDEISRAAIFSSLNKIKNFTVNVPAAGVLAPITLLFTVPPTIVKSLSTYPSAIDVAVHEPEVTVPVVVIDVIFPVVSPLLCLPVCVLKSKLKNVLMYC